jgi:hypothetical protein
VRLSANVRAETDRFVESNNADLDKLGGSLRAQYVDPNNDQSFSPYFAYAPRTAFAPTFSREVETRNDLNLGFNKIFNFDGNFQGVPFASNTGASTVWSFGLTAFGQRRFREPTSSSYALFVIPSLSYAISEQWNASLAVEVIGRWFDSNAAGLFRNTHRDGRICDSGIVVWRSGNRGAFRPARVGHPDIFGESDVKLFGLQLSPMDSRCRDQDGWRF